MTLHLKIIKSPGGLPPSETEKSFGEAGATIGRGSGNDWALNDPERFLSSRHCQIISRKGHYVIIDLSTNGTFLNGSAQPVGKGEEATLNDGDEFEVGDYRFAVQIQAAADKVTPSSFGLQPEIAKPTIGRDLEPLVASSDPSNPFTSDSLAPGSSGPVDSLPGSASEETDPLALLDGPGRADWKDPVYTDDASLDPRNSHSDGAGALNQAFSLPGVAQDNALIPDDWDSDPVRDASDGRSANALPEESVTGPVDNGRTPPKADTDRHGPVPPRPRADDSSEVVAPRPEISATANQQSSGPRHQQTGTLQPDPAQPPTAAVTDRQQLPDSSLIDALGIDGRQLTSEHIREIHQMVGRLTRETVIGMMLILRSRASIKNEFRMNVTTIQPVENNPLKFSANIDDALENMFVKQGSAYKNPVAAVREGYEDIADHQVAILAGIRSAFESMIKSFDPEVLESQFDRQNTGKLIPGLGRGRYWNAYSEFYKSLIDNMENSFQHLFGSEFVQAYEEQLRKLARARNRDLQRPGS